MLLSKPFERALPRANAPGSIVSRLRSIEPKRAALAIVLLVCSVAGWYYVAIKGESRSAFNRWQPMLAELVAGEDVYYRHAFPTPPIMGLILYPFTLLPGPWAMAGWFAFKTLLLCWVIWRLLASWQETGWPVGIYAVGFILLIGLRPALGDLLHGNVNLWILFLIVAAVFSFRDRRDACGGLCLSLAIACKLTPALLIFYFALKRSWKFCAWTAAGLLLWLVIVPGSVLGFKHNLILLDHWANMMVWPYVKEGQVDTEQVNQSLPGLIHRLTTESMAIKGEDGAPDVQVNVWSLSPPAARWLTRIVLGSMLLVLFCVLCQPLPDRSDPRLWHEVGLVLLAMLLFSERSWKHHYVTILPGVVALVAYVCHKSVQVRRTRSIVCWMLGIAAAMMAVTSNDLARPLFGVQGAKLAQAYGAYVWAAFALASAHIACLKAIGKREPESATA